MREFEGAFDIESVTIAEAIDSPRRVPRFRVLSDSDLEMLPEPQWQIAGMLPVGGLGVLFGAPGSFKSFVAIDLANATANGHPWHNVKVRRGRVVYTMAEGSHGAKIRQRAWKRSRSILDRVDVDFVTEPVNLLDATAVRAFIADVLASGPAPVLVILDTWHACMAGAGENDAKDTGIAIDSCRMISRETGAAVIALHHPGKANEQERGSSSLRGAADFMARVTRQGMFVTIGGGDGYDKVKDGPAFSSIRQRLEQVGDSLAVGTTDFQGVEDEELTDNDLKALRALSTSFLADGASFTEWRQASGVPNTSFARSRTQLVRRAYVVEIKEGQRKSYTLSTEGQAVLGTKYQQLPRRFQTDIGTDAATSASAHSLLETVSVVVTQGANVRAETSTSTARAVAVSNAEWMTK